MPSKNKPGCNCCVEPCEEPDCDMCDVNPRPTAIKVVLSGITNDGCTLCSRLNGTWIVPCTGLITTPFCKWQRNFLSGEIPSCPSNQGGLGDSNIVVTITDSGADVEVSVIITYVTTVIDLSAGFLKTYTGVNSIDCEFSSVSIPFSFDFCESSGGLADCCDFTLATCVITAV